MKDTRPKVNPFLSLLGSVFKSISFVIGTFFLATLLEWFGMHLWWQSASEDRLYQRTQHEIQKIESTVGANFDRHWFRRVYSYVSTLSDRVIVPLEQHLDFQQRELEHSPQSMSAIGSAVVQIQHSINRHSSVALEVFHAWLFRLLTFIFGIVSVLPLVVVGLIDGLVRREIRRWSGGRESAWLFVFAIKSLVPSLAVIWALYVLWPWHLPFLWINSLMGVCWGCALTMALAKFKKYL